MKKISSRSIFRCLSAVLTLVLLPFLAGCAAESTAQEKDVPENLAEASFPKRDPLDYPEWETVPAGEHGEWNQRTNLVQRGRRVYDKYCVGCHGDYGDGEGPAAVRLITQPRDFTSGIYKFRSTDSGSLPLDSDLHRTITRGLSRVSMPAFRLMPEGDKMAVIAYIKSFYPRWDEERTRRRVIHIPAAPDDLKDEERILRGRAVYVQMQCFKCHGTDGRGTGATQTEYMDAWGDLQKPFDFTRGALKGGNSPEDIYRTFHTGLRSIMPAYEGEALAAVTAEAFDGMTSFDGMEEDVEEAARLERVRNAFPADGNAIFVEMSEGERLELAQRNSWDLVAYILALRSRTTTASAVLGISHSTDGP